MLHAYVRICATAIACGIALGASTASSETLRQVVTVKRPDLPRRAADAAVAGLAKRAYLEALIGEKMSQTLIDARGDEIRAAFEPVDSVLGGFTVISQQDQPDGTTRVTCEADVDIGQVLVKLVASKVISFSEDAPRILLVPSGAGSDIAVKALRARLGNGLGQAGFTLLAAEATPTASVAKWRSSPEGTAWMQRTVAETRADLVGLIGIVSSAVPSAVGGRVLDVEIQYTVVRPGDNAIVAEQAFSARGSGATALLAEQAVLDDLGPRISADLSGKLASAVFDGGQVIDGSGALSDVITVNIFFRPSSRATSELKGYLEQQGLAVDLGNSSIATIEAEVRNRVGDPGFDSKKVGPADRLIVTGQTTVGRLFDLLNGASLGSEKLKVSVIEYGDNYLGVEILAPTAPPRVPPVSTKPPTSSPSATTPRPLERGDRAASTRPPMVYKKKVASHNKDK